MRSKIIVTAMILLFSSTASLRAWAESLSGSGAWKSDKFEAEGSWTADFTQVEDELTGGITLTGSPLFTGGTISGVVTDGATITFGVMEDENKVASFTGKLDGTKATGTYQSLTGGDEGTWSGTLSARPSSPQ